MTDLTETSTKGQPVTITEHTGAAQHGDEARLRVDRARADADLVLEIAHIAEEGLGETEIERDRRHLLEEGLHVLRWLLDAPWSERTMSVDRVLHDEKGELLPRRVVAYIDRVMGGQSSLSARQAMVRETRSHAILQARSGVAMRLHDLADRTREQAARAAVHEASPVRRGELPAAARVEAHQPPPLPQRLVPPAPPESAVEQTGQIIGALRASGHEIPAELERAARKDGKSGIDPAGPAMGQPVDPNFAATALPQPRIGDTQRLDVAELLAAEAPAGHGEAASGPRPFQTPGDAAAPPAAKTGAGDGSDGGDGDE